MCMCVCVCTHAHLAGEGWEWKVGMEQDFKMEINPHHLHTHIHICLEHIRVSLVQAGFRKGRGTRDQIANICWIIEKARAFQQDIYFCFIDYAKAFDSVDHNKLWKSLKEMEIPDHLTYFLRNLYAGQEATELDMEQQTGSKQEKEYVKAVYCHPAYLTSMQSTS